MYMYMYINHSSHEGVVTSAAALCVPAEPDCRGDQDGGGGGE